MKSAEQLRDEHLALPPILPALREQLAAIPGVLGVSVGFRVCEGRMLDELAFVVTVAEKLPLSRVPSAQRIPRFVDGTRVVPLA